MFLTVSYCSWLSITVSPNSMELLHVSKFLLWLPAISYCVFLYYVDAACLSLSLIVSSYQSFSLLVPWNFLLSLTISKILSL